MYIDINILKYLVYYKCASIIINFSMKLDDKNSYAILFSNI